jgi:threonine dehydrogenase-like Zn-dependent dehydrogenase
MSTPVNAIVFEKINQVGTGSFRLPDLAPGMLLARAHYTFVSPGTELRVLANHYGVEGRYPLIPGCAAVGEVIAVAPDVRGFRIGDRISYCPDPGEAVKPLGIHSHWGGHVSHHLVPISTHPILLPENANLLDYAITEVAAISLRGAVSAQPQPGETAVVIGQGTIGAFSAGWLAAFGCKVIVCDLEEFRIQRALKFGAAAGVNARASDARDRLLAHTDGGADIVVESSGATPGVKLAHSLLRRAPLAFRQSVTDGLARWPRLVYQANYLDEVPVNPHDYFGSEGLVVLAPCDRGREDRIRTVEYIRQKRIDPRAFIDRVVSWREAPAVYQALREKPGSVCSVAFSWID